MGRGQGALPHVKARDMRQPAAVEAYFLSNCLRNLPRLDFYMLRTPHGFACSTVDVKESVRILASSPFADCVTRNHRACAARYAGVEYRRRSFARIG